MVARERTHKRDLLLNDRHRLWGDPLVMTDIDHMVEYHARFGEVTATALVEYKLEYAKPVPQAHHNAKALVNVGDRANLPVFGVRYARDFSWWLVTPLNSRARQWVPEDHAEMSERQYVALLYRLRGEPMPSSLFNDEGRLRAAA
jgi:hypothetical protein